MQTPLQYVATTVELKTNTCFKSKHFEKSFSVFHDDECKIVSYRKMFLKIIFTEHNSLHLLRYTALYVRVKRVFVVVLQPSQLHASERECVRQRENESATPVWPRLFFSFFFATIIRTTTIRRGGAAAVDSSVLSRVPGGGGDSGHTVSIARSTFQPR